MWYFQQNGKKARFIYRGRNEIKKSNLMIMCKELDVPVCQDTGIAVTFMEVGQDVHFVGGDLTEAINEGVRQGYSEGYLRKSVVRDPLDRVNTGDNTPAMIYYDIVPGDVLEITFGERTLKIRVLAVQEHVTKAGATELYEVVE